MMLLRVPLAALAWLTLSWSTLVWAKEGTLLFNDTLGTGAPESCFPALGFEVPATVPSSLDGWWCDSSTEYAFVGFSYEITQCKFDPSRLLVRRLTFGVYTGQSRSRLKSEFADIRNRFNGRYIRLYGACDRANY